MKILKTSNYIKKAKYPKEEIEPYNPWAVCNDSTGGKKEEPAKFERCVNHVKEQNVEDNKLEDTKDMRGRTRNYRTDPSPDEFFNEKLDALLEGTVNNDAQSEEDRTFDEMWNNAWNRQKNKEHVFSSTISKK